nr:hypothetical protein [uncultured Desulfobulbus sp.]
MKGNLAVYYLILIAIMLFAYTAQHELHAKEVLGEFEAARVANMNKGWVDSITADGIVIDDIYVPLSSVKLYDQGGFLKDISSLRVGEYVAFQRDGERMEIHQVDEVGERPGETATSVQKSSGSAPPSDKVIRQVDGVWKN